MRYWLVYSSFDGSGWKDFGTREEAERRGAAMQKDHYKLQYIIIYGVKS